MRGVTPGGTLGIPLPAMNKGETKRKMKLANKLSDEIWGVQYLLAVREFFRTFVVTVEFDTRPPGTTFGTP